MVRNKFSWLVYMIVGLAVVGVIVQLFTNTASFFTNLLWMLVIGAVISAAVYFIFLRKRAPSHETRKYKQAVKQSKMKYKSKNSSPNKAAPKRPHPVQMKRKLNKRASHLKVIDGNKSKRKNRASF